jgi:hypothetical protein
VHKCGSNFRERSAARPECRQKPRLPRPPFRTASGDHHADKKDLSGPALAQRRKIGAGSEKEAAEMVCGLPLSSNGRLAQLRARVLRFGDVRQRSATDFFTAE